MDQKALLALLEERKFKELKEELGNMYPVDIAETLDSVPRAVGGACGGNPLPVIIPCHRVVASNGLGGFNHTSGSGWLMEIKCWLLRHEGVLPQTLL